MSYLCEKLLKHPDNMKQLVNHFAVDCDVKEVRPLGDGLINTTYRVVTGDGTPDYVLQRINNNVFTDVDLLQDNISRVTDFIRQRMKDSGEADVERKVLRFIPVKGSDKTYFKDGDDYWRLSVYIDDAETKSEVNEDSAYSAGKAFGNFQAILADFPGTLGETIPDFHTMSFRLRQLDDAVASDPLGRVAGVRDLLQAIDTRREKMCQPEKWHKEGLLPKRICHCDTKVNNMMFDSNGDVLCVIDLDTVMPSFVFSDFGDFLRTAACTTSEDEPDTDKIDFKMDIFKAFAKGYIEATKSFLTGTERDWLPQSVALFPYMQAVRFLTDWINGDTYYRIAYPEHNLVRTRAQMRLLDRVEAAMPQLQACIAGLI